MSKLDRQIVMADQFQRAGGGIWFANEDEKSVLVSVTFYPKEQLKIKGKPITKEELEKNYHRLKLRHEQ